METGPGIDELLSSGSWGKNREYLIEKSSKRA
jgi:hypothetical protein